MQSRAEGKEATGSWSLAYNLRWEFVIRKTLFAILVPSLSARAIEGRLRVKTGRGKLCIRARRIPVCSSGTLAIKSEARARMLPRYVLAYKAQ